MKRNNRAENETFVHYLLKLDDFSGVNTRFAFIISILVNASLHRNSMTLNLNVTILEDIFV